jgi:YaaC-like Protein
MPGRGQYIGSFQTGVRVKSENPLEEVWSRVAMHGSGDYLRRLFAPPAGEDSEPYVQYASVRLRQAVEFREVTRQATLLTAPLSLYYSFLNLTRACLCLKLDMLGSGGHGLKFRKSGDLLSSAAELRGGTFTDYLHEVGYSYRSGKVVSLHDALSRIIEIRTDYAETYGRESLVFPIDVDAHFSGEVVLKIPQRIYDISRASPDWTSELPTLSGCCTAGSEGNNLEATFRVSRYEDVSSFCSLRLEPSLLSQEFESRWHLVRQTDPDLVFPRPAYYFIALFILGSVVRYEPEMMLDSVVPGSLTGWLLKRVVQSAERFFPQLMLSWLEGTTVYF